MVLKISNLGREKYNKLTLKSLENKSNAFILYRIKQKFLFLIKMIVFNSAITFKVLFIKTFCFFEKKPHKYLHIL